MILTEDDHRYLLNARRHRRALKQLQQFLHDFECPSCEVPGAFWPHGGAEQDDLRGVARWQCKQCGFYLGPEGEQWAKYDPIVDLTNTPLHTWGCWQLERDASEYAFLPSEIIAEHGEAIRKKLGLE